MLWQSFQSRGRSKSELVYTQMALICTLPEQGCCVRRKPESCGLKDDRKGAPSTKCVLRYILQSAEASVRQSEDVDGLSSSRCLLSQSQLEWLTYGLACRYISSTGDDVVGVVLERHAENFVVDIGAPFPAVLNILSFEGATRRNRPKLAEGDLVYARVVLAHRDIDTELSCTDAGGKVRIPLQQRRIPCATGIFVGGSSVSCPQSMFCMSGVGIRTLERRPPDKLLHSPCKATAGVSYSSSLGGSGELPAIRDSHWPEWAGLD